MSRMLNIVLTTLTILLATMVVIPPAQATSTFSPDDLLGVWEATLTVNNLELITSPDVPGFGGPWDGIRAQATHQLIVTPAPDGTVLMMMPSLFGFTFAITVEGDRLEGTSLSFSPGHGSAYLTGRISESGGMRKLDFQLMGDFWVESRAAGQIFNLSLEATLPLGTRDHAPVPPAAATPAVTAPLPEVPTGLRLLFSRINEHISSGWRSLSEALAGESFTVLIPTATCGVRG